MSETDRTSNPSSKSKTPSTGTGVSSSQHSSLSAGAPRPYNPSAHPARRLRSQYPRGDSENHVEYILVASFDIDRGPVMEHQYPVAITGDEHMLAELMLPDQAHVRNQDWTMFFLHKDTSQEEEDEERKAKENRRKRRQRKRNKMAGIPKKDEEEEEDEEDDDDDEDLDDDDDDWDDDVSSDSEPEGGEGPPLIYVLNLVNTKQDKTVKRGAVVKAMAICTRHPFLHIYKPLLLLALEEYFKSPVPETLALLYDAVNNMDLSLMPKLSLLERHLLQASENKDLFVEKFEQMIQMRIAEDRGENVTDQPFDASRDPPKPLGIARAGTKAHFEGQAAYSVPRDTHEFESKVMYKGIPIPIKVPVAVMPETVGDFSLIKLIQNFSDTHAKSPQPFALHPHLTTNGANTHPIIILVNALLTQKRIIFLGHNMPSGEVAEAVLAACALASGGVLRGFTRHAFPYTDLTKIDDLLNVPGFIAGVTNPTFELHPEWWDLLCDLPSGKMKISSKIEPAAITEGLVYFQQQNPAYAGLVAGSSSNNSSGSDLTGDAAFMNDILKSVAARHGERVIRAKWRDWVLKFTRIAAAFEESVYGASALYIGGDDFDTGSAVVNGHGYVWPDDASKQKELAGNVTRIEGWRNTRSYYSFIQDLAQLYTVRPLKGLDLHHMHDRLRTQRLTPAQSKEIYLAFSKYVYSYDEICLLLTVAPESHAGLFYLALGLFHKDRVVRIRTAELLERIAEHEAGQHWWNSLSRFEKLAYIRIKREAEVEMKERLEKEGFSPDVEKRVS
ncbi:putative spindle pole body interacting protein [Phaeoacremonium minimum UCRPA7]|uniref:Putative spindle pole body interacting protein n=1 Tax=Phaeoacremonium minimum (strain UCR-PA7) TaxID=1286976 RepID=R8BXS6_PHAM7|nr:putative spindle pole body interacting protein [Phaeoacremonium minimum UCRPA7]EOO04084.1 putative spindle pole body interacting protein [Phaeoacremonium minimum UCRPA7]